MNSLYYLGLDVHKKTISYCLKRADGSIAEEGTVAARRQDLSIWVKALPGPWKGALEATLFTGWIYDFLRPHALTLEASLTDARHCRFQEKERQNGCPEDRRYGSLQLTTGLLHGTMRNQACPN